MRQAPLASLSGYAFELATSANRIVLLVPSAMAVSEEKPGASFFSNG
jgi:hypothetical protein